MEKAFNDIKELLISPPVLKAPTPDGLFHLGSDTSQEGVGGTLLQKQGEEWVVIGYHSVTSVVFESKDDPTQMTKIVIYNYILYYIQKTIHSKLICTNVHS